MVTEINKETKPDRRARGHVKLVTIDPVKSDQHLNATDVVVIPHASGAAAYCNCNIAVNKSILVTVRASIYINGRAKLTVTINWQTPSEEDGGGRGFRRRRIEEKKDG